MDSLSWKIISKGRSRAVLLQRLSVKWGVEVDSIIAHLGHNTGYWAIAQRSGHILTNRDGGRP